MCKNCKASELGQTRQAELDAALEACKAANINPGTAGFIVRYARTRIIPKDEHPDAQAAVERYNAAQQAMKDLHNDYVFGMMRQAAEVERTRREAQQAEDDEHYITHIYLGGE
jgi:hypothetical protein